MEKLSNVLKNSVIISVKDLERIKRNAQFITEEDEDIRNKRLRRLSAEKKVQEHKEKIILVDKGKAKIRIEESEEEKRITMKNREICEKARLIQLKSHDAVKTLDKMILYAKTATVRDRQIREKEEKEKIEKKKDEKLDLQIEIIRLREIKKQEYELASIKRKQIESGKVIINQIQEREKEHTKEKVQKEKDYKAMLTEVKRIQDEDIVSLQKKKTRLEEIMKDMIHENEKSIRLKKLVIQREREKDIDLFNYNMEKAKKEEERIQQLNQIAKEREFHLQQLREQQETENSKQVELDVIRAQRAFEANERVEREKVLNELKNKQKKMRELNEANTKMIRFKQAQLSMEGIKEKEDYEKIIKEQIAAYEADKLKKENERKLRLEHNFQLRKQIKTNEEVHDLEKRENIEEGRKIKRNNERYQKEIEAIKQERIAYLKSLEIKPLYIVDLERFSTASI